MYNNQSFYQQYRAVIQSLAETVLQQNVYYLSAKNNIF